MDLGLIYDAEFRTYFDYGGIENFRNMVLFSLAKYANISEIKPASPMKRLKTVTTTATFRRRCILKRLRSTKAGTRNQATLRKMRHGLLC